MRGWVRLMYDFGIPHVTYTLDARSPLGRAFAERLVPFAKVLEEGNPSATLIDELTAFVKECRPSLGEPTLIGFGRDLFRHRWLFEVVSPSLGRVAAGEEAPTERLETCAGCDKPLPEYCWYRAGPGGKTEVVCSDGCVRRPTPSKPLDGPEPDSPLVR